MSEVNAPCGCGIGSGRKAVAVDPELKERNLKRLRRIEGQVRGVARMVEEERYCADIMTQVSSVQEALRSVGRELMRNHLRHCATRRLRESGPCRCVGTAARSFEPDGARPIGPLRQLTRRRDFQTVVKSLSARSGPRSPKTPQRAQPRRVVRRHRRTPPLTGLSPRGLSRTPHRRRSRSQSTSTPRSNRDRCWPCCRACRGTRCG